MDTVQKTMFIFYIMFKCVYSCVSKGSSRKKTKNRMISFAKFINSQER